MNKIISVVGSTASGKTEWAVKLAKKFNGAVLNADSRQIYTEMNIGTGKPPLTDRGGSASARGHAGDADSSTFVTMLANMVTSKQRSRLSVLLNPLYYQNIEHYLFNIVRPDEHYHAAQFQKDAYTVIDYLHSRNILPILAGGTGLYIAAVTKNYQFGPGGQKSRKKGPPKYDVLQIGIDIPRQKLYERINARIQQMYKQGLKQEALNLYKKYGQDSILSKTIGYKEWASLCRHCDRPSGKKENLREKMWPTIAKPRSANFPSDAEIVAKIQKNARNYARRQLTWFRHDPLTQWVKTFNQARRLALNFLKNG